MPAEPARGLQELHCPQERLELSQNAQKAGTPGIRRDYRTLGVPGEIGGLRAQRLLVQPIAVLHRWADGAAQKANAVNSSQAVDADDCDACGDSARTQNFALGHFEDTAGGRPRRDSPRLKHQLQRYIIALKILLLLLQSNLVNPVLLLFGNLLLGQNFLAPESVRKKLEKSKM